MNLFIVLTVISFALITCESTPADLNPVPREENNTDSYLGTLQLIRKYGYPAEAHLVETADGYLLELHRIPYGKNPDLSDEETRKPPVFIQHGLLGSSEDFLLIGSPDALPFLLADLGFDVWLGNVRGNLYTRAHVTLFPNDNKFWNFTWHQSAIYDVPAQIDFICNYTNHEKIIYVGFSMGTTMFFVMTSTLPEYNDKIELSLLMAAVGYVKNIRSPLLRFLALFADEIKGLDDLIAKGEFMPDNKVLRLFRELFCEKNNIQRRLCLSVIFSVVGSDPEQFNKKLLPVILNHYPAGYSGKAVNHYAQMVKSGKFQQYDYGTKGNRLEYGTPTPPEYNLKAITAPMYFYEGQNDYLSSMKDVHHIAEQLTTLRRIRVVDYPAFSHLDFMVSLDVKKLVYDILIGDLMSHLNDNNNV